MFFPRKVKFTIDFSDFYVIILFARADVMELADVTDSKSVALTGMRVRPPPSAPNKIKAKNTENIDVICVFRLFHFLFVSTIWGKNRCFALSNCCQNIG